MNEGLLSAWWAVVLVAVIGISLVWMVRKGSR
jgi:hypothetical protein